jgi:hypothetical protein
MKFLLFLSLLIGTQCFAQVTIKNPSEKKYKISIDPSAQTYKEGDLELNIAKVIARDNIRDMFLEVRRKRLDEVLEHLFKEKSREDRMKEYAEIVYAGVLRIEKKECLINNFIKLAADLPESSPKHLFKENMINCKS